MIRPLSFLMIAAIPGLSAIGCKSSPASTSIVSADDLAAIKAAPPGPERLAKTEEVLKNYTPAGPIALEAFLAEWSADQAASEAKYGGNYVQLTGRVVSVREHAVYQLPHLTLKPKGVKEFADASFAAAHAEKVRAIAPETEVALRCLVAFDPVQVTLSGCTFAESSAPTTKPE